MGVLGVWVCMCLCREVFVCVSGYAFHRSLRYGAETWHGGRKWVHEVQEHIFEATPKKVKGHPGDKLLWKCPRLLTHDECLNPQLS